MHIVIQNFKDTAWMVSQNMQASKAKTKSMHKLPLKQSYFSRTKEIKTKSEIKVFV